MTKDGRRRTNSDHHPVRRVGSIQSIRSELRTPNAPMPTASNGSALLDVHGLTKIYPAAGAFGGARQSVRAVDDVSFVVGEREMFGLVGESGCGKTTVARCVLNLIPATAGEVLFEGRDLLRLPRGEMRGVRRRLQVVF